MELIRLLTAFVTVLGISFSQYIPVAHSADFGTYQTPFSPDSLWNSKPLNPVLSNIGILPSTYNATAYTPAYSATCYFADSTSPPGVVKAKSEKQSIHDRDREEYLSEITIPHWPSGVVPATSADGHADIIDLENKIIHSFWQLKFINNEWTAQLYSWAPLTGSGWPDPAHFYQGARAAGVPSCAGMIRVHEVNDGDTMFRHALALSLTHNSLSSSIPYVFPATSSDINLSGNTGLIPQGALLMLPPNFDLSRIKTPLVKKIANTLKTYGAYVVDRNSGTPYVIYSEIGADTRSTGGAYSEHTLIQQSLRMVSNVSRWADGNGNVFTPNKNLNILSMRGPWSRGFNYQADSKSCESSCDIKGTFDTYQQAVIYETTDEQIIESNSSGRSITRVNWARPKKGDAFQLTAATTGGGKLRLVIRDPGKNDLIVYDSGYLNNNQVSTFVWPLNEFEITTVISSGVGERSSISGMLVRIE